MASIFGAIKAILGYLWHLEWTERVQKECIFCNRANFRSTVYEDDDLIAVDNIRSSGQFHWLVMPKAHLLRDVEGLDGSHKDLVDSLDKVKAHLLRERCPDIAASEVHAGYHRGRRPLWRNIYYPDIVSIHHLHLHVIVRPYFWRVLFKYPSWFPLMWKSDETVAREVEALALKKA